MVSASRSTAKSSRSRFWLALHGWCALPLWGFIFFICLTGTVATVSDEIVWLIEPAARSNAPSWDAQKIGYDEILRRVDEQQPGTAVLFMEIPVKGQFALKLYVGRPDGSEATYYVNPYTGRIQGEVPTLDLKGFLRELHGWLLIPFTTTYSLGWYLVSAMSIPLLGSLITGVIVYKKFWRAYLRPRLRIGAGARVFWGDLHRLAGIWSIPFIAIMSVTAFWFLLEAILHDTGRRLPGEREEPHIPRPQVITGLARTDAHKVSLDQAIAIARTSFPGLDPAFVELPHSAYAPIEIFGRSAYPLVFEAAHINPYSGKIVATRGIRDMDAVALVTESMRPLHTGDFAGLWLKLVYFLFGLLLTMMSLSGMLVWTKRSAQATAKLVSHARASRQRNGFAAEAGE